MENNNATLPELTVDVFKRSKCPQWAKWAAVDMDGDSFFFSHKPVCGHTLWWQSDGKSSYIRRYDPSGWRNSLIERPEVKNCDKQETEIKNAVNTDDVKHPNHYTDTPFGLEVIEITKHYDFCTGNALKYIFRHGKKVYDGLTVKDSAIKDLRKAIQNLEFRIKVIEEDWKDDGTIKEV